MTDLRGNWTLYNEAQTIKHSSLEVQAAAVSSLTPQPLLLLSLSLSLSLSVSFCLPRSLFEEVRFSLSLLFSPIAADELQVPRISLSAEAALPLCVCGRCCGAAGDDWQRIQPSRGPDALRAAAPFLVAGASLLFPAKVAGRD